VRVLFQLLADLEPAEARHHDVEEDEVRGVRTREIQGRLSAVRHDDIELFGGQCLVDDLDVDRIVVDDEDNQSGVH